MHNNSISEAFHLDKFPLLTQKYGDYKLFKQAYKLVLNKEHLTPQGLRKIVAIKASLNLGLSDLLKISFPDIIPVARSLIPAPQIKDGNWLAGFTTGEGCFMIKIKPSNTKLGEAVHLEFQTTQHNRDEKIIKRFISYFKAGNCNDIGKGSYRLQSCKIIWYY